TRAFGHEDLFPINIAGLEFGGRCVTTIRASYGGTHTESALSKVQAVANLTADAVIVHPADMTLIDSALVDKVLDEPANRIISERCDNGGAHTEAALQTAGNVILAAAFPDAKLARGGNAAVARIEPQHHFAETYKVPLAAFYRFDFERCHRLSAHPSTIYNQNVSMHVVAC